MICASPELAALDRAVARLYAGVPRTDRQGWRKGRDVGGLFLNQRDWLNERSKCEDQECLIGEYDERLFDLFVASDTPTQDYSSKPVNGTLSILYVGGSWYVFHIQGLWIGRAPGAVNDTQGFGHFQLNGGKAKIPASEDACGWSIQKLRDNRWSFEEIPFEKDYGGCGGVNATATGIYSR